MRFWKWQAGEGEHLLVVGKSHLPLLLLYCSWGRSFLRLITQLHCWILKIPIEEVLSGMIGREVLTVWSCQWRQCPVEESLGWHRPPEMLDGATETACCGALHQEPTAVSAPGGCFWAQYAPDQQREGKHGRFFSGLLLFSVLWWFEGPLQLWGCLTWLKANRLLWTHDN